ncbi:hypothetical protein KC669_00215 [Candidatus Dojkabacteria bacterium]|uniref:Uncharacterized protein n=1 Tax=Candidatus Dojkabacteria bacterium TaxID=2099670 RepID=A0A955LA35_9BACT|nr:hypothetical protein [Candidatus Dojkabacteria bacterium]
MEEQTTEFGNDSKQTNYMQFIEDELEEYEDDSIGTELNQRIKAFARMIDSNQFGDYYLAEFMDRANVLRDSKFMYQIVTSCSPKQISSINHILNAYLPTHLDSIDKTKINDATKFTISYTLQTLNAIYVTLESVAYGKKQTER